jgi:hypothetical protein
MESPSAPIHPEGSPAAFPMMPKVGERPVKGNRAKTYSLAAESDSTAKTPDQIAAPGWRKARGGLFWVLFGLFFLALPGFIGFAKGALDRSGVAIPKGDGWVIPGYVNTDDPGSVRMKKEEQIDAIAYAAPVIIAGLAFSFGRLTCGAAPRSSGSKALFAFSGFFTFAALLGLVTAGVSHKLLLKETYHYASVGFLIVGSLAEFCFLVGLAASGLTLKRPKAARAVGLIGFFFAITAAIPTVGWSIYTQEWRNKHLNDDLKIAEQAALMLGWLLLIGVYWRAVGTVRRAIRDFLRNVA